MKQFPDYKMQFSKLIKKIIPFFILGIFFIPLLLPVVSVNAQTARELQDKISQKDADIAKLEQEIAAYQLELGNLEKQKTTLSGAVKSLDLTKKKLMTDIAVSQNKIDKISLEIQGLSKDIVKKQSSIGNDILAISEGIRATNELEGSSLLTTILSESDFTTAWNDIDNLSVIRDQIRQIIPELQQTKNALEGTRNSTIDAKNQLTLIKSKLGDQQKIVVQNTNEKTKLLTQTKSSEANYQKLLQQRIAQRDAFEKELRDYEAQLKYTLDPTKLPAGRVLSWPLEKIFVTQLFGKTVDSVRLYASGTHSGVDFRASTGTPVMAMADGTVLGVGDTDLTCPGASFGKFVFIKYNNGLSSTFGHLSLPKVKEGDTVKRGEVVAYSGATGHVTGPHLHVSLYASEAVKMASMPSAACGGRIYRLPVAAMSAYLDVMAYLPPYIINTSILNNKTAE